MDNAQTYNVCVNTRNSAGYRGSVQRDPGCEVAVKTGYQLVPFMENNEI